MKTITKLMRYVVMALSIIFAALGVYVADLVIGFSPVLVRGILGVAVIFLAIRAGLASRNKEPVESIFVFPRNIRFFILVFGYTIMFYWAIEQILEATRYFTSR